jgi:hypothetical protein
LIYNCIYERLSLGLIRCPRSATLRWPDQPPPYPIPNPDAPAFNPNDRPRLVRSRANSRPAQAIASTRCAPVTRKAQPPSPRKSPRNPAKNRDPARNLITPAHRPALYGGPMRAQRYLLPSADPNPGAMPSLAPSGITRRPTPMARVGMPAVPKRAKRCQGAPNHANARHHHPKCKTNPPPPPRVCQISKRTHRPCHTLPLFSASPASLR